MRLKLTAHGVELSAELREFVLRRAHFQFGRFAGSINALSVRLADKSCDIRVDGLSHPVVVQERQESIHAAVAIAMERAERAVKRQLSLS